MFLLEYANPISLLKEKIFFVLLTVTVTEPWPSANCLSTSIMCDHHQWRHYLSSSSVGRRIEFTFWIICTFGKMKQLAWNISPCQEQLIKIYRKSQEQLIKIYRPCQEQLIKIYRPCQEQLIKIYRPCQEQLITCERATDQNI